MKLHERLLSRTSSQPDTTNGASIARQWLERGFRTVVVDAPTPGNRKSGKMPHHGDDWWNNADTLASFDPARYRGKNVGICGGHPLDGGGFLTIIDCDGAEGLALFASLGVCPETFTVRSGSGTGKHFFFRTNIQYGGPKLGANIDTRCVGGQVVAPGCSHYTGGQYTVEKDIEIAWAPAWLEDKLGVGTSRTATLSEEQVSGFPAVNVTREMCAAQAEKLGVLHSDYAFFSKLAQGAPLAPKGQRHKIADLHGTQTLVDYFTPGVTDESVMLLMLATYPDWSTNPIGPGRDPKNWIDCLVGLRGARFRYEPSSANAPVSEKQLKNAMAALRREIKLVKKDAKTHFEGAVFRLGKFVPGVLSEEHVKRDLYKAAGESETGFKTVDECDEMFGMKLAMGQETAKQGFIRKGWRSRLLENPETRALIPCEENAHLFLTCHDDVQGLLRFNVRQGRPTLEREPPWTTRITEYPALLQDYHAPEIGAWLATQLGGRPLASSKTVLTAVNHAAHADEFDPFLDWLKGLKWDGVPRLDTWLIDYAKAEDSRYTRLVGAKFLIGVAARTFIPNSQVDSVLVLVGPERRGKSRLLRTLAGEEYFTDELRDITNKDSHLLMERFAIVEIAELDKLMLWDDAEVKSFITARSVFVRPAYAREARIVERRAGLAASTNEAEFLKSVTGNRRFWPVPTPAFCDLDGIAAAREQLWAEATFRYLNKEAWWFVEEKDYREAEQRQEEVRVKDELEYSLDFLDDTKPPPKTLMDGGVDVNWVRDQFEDGGQGRFKWVTNMQVCQMLGLDYKKRQDQVRASKVLRSKGWVAKVEKIAGRSQRIYRRN